MEGAVPIATHIVVRTRSARPRPELESFIYAWPLPVERSRARGYCNNRKPIVTRIPQRIT